MRVDHYDWPGGREAMLRFGPSDGPVVIAAMPLLEEWNRTRAFVVALMRALAARGIAGVLPDLPGHGESMVRVADMTVLRLAEAMQAVSERLSDEGSATVALGVRGGALLDHCSLHLARWHLAPMTGAEVMGDLHKVWLAGGGRPVRTMDAMIYGQDGPVTIAGTPLSADFLSSLTMAEPFDRPGIPRRVVRLASDLRTADRHVEGAPLWRRAEPGSDPALVETLADDLADWVRSCVA